MNVPRYTVGYSEVAGFARETMISKTGGSRGESAVSWRMDLGPQENLNGRVAVASVVIRLRQFSS
jgi:hypothetical protein